MQILVILLKAFLFQQMISSSLLVIEKKIVQCYAKFMHGKGFSIVFFSYISS
jgi:hypothetical protein